LQHVGQLLFDGLLRLPDLLLLVTRELRELLRRGLLLTPCFSRGVGQLLSRLFGLLGRLSRLLTVFSRLGLLRGCFDVLLRLLDRSLRFTCRLGRLGSRRFDLLCRLRRLLLRLLVLAIQLLRLRLRHALLILCRRLRLSGSILLFGRSFLQLARRLIERVGALRQLGPLAFGQHRFGLRDGSLDGLFGFAGRLLSG